MLPSASESAVTYHLDSMYHCAWRLIPGAAFRVTIGDEELV